MDGDAADIELLLASARHELSVLRSDPRLLDPLPGKRGAALREHVLDLLGAVEYRIAHAPRRDATSSACRAFARSLRQGIQVLRAAHAALPWLATTRSPSINLGSLYVTEEWARSLVGADVDLVMVPDPEFMYVTTSWPFLEVIELTRGFKQKAKRRPIVLNYPLCDSDRLLLHPIFAHELGHASVHEHKLVGLVESQLDADPAFVAALRDVTMAMATQLPGVVATQIVSVVRANLRDWIEELLCDQLATAAMGPAFAWAFAAFAMPLSYRKPGREHPPNTVRMQHMLEQLTQHGWRPYMERVAPVVTQWLDDIAADAGTPIGDVLHTFVRDQLLAHSAALHDVATARIGSDVLDVATIEPDADEVARLLGHLILPVGLDRLLRPRGILLGGWQAAFEKHGDRPASLVHALADTQLQELVGKAIELSTVASSWEPGT